MQMPDRMQTSISIDSLTRKSYFIRVVNFVRDFDGLPDLSGVREDC